MSVKDEWVKEVKKVLLNQFDQIKGEFLCFFLHWL